MKKSLEILDAHIPEGTVVVAGGALLVDLAKESRTIELVVGVWIPANSFRRTRVVDITQIIQKRWSVTVGTGQQEIRVAFVPKNI